MMVASKLQQTAKAEMSKHASFRKPESLNEEDSCCVHREFSPFLICKICVLFARNLLLQLIARQTAMHQVTPNNLFVLIVSHDSHQEDKFTKLSSTKLLIQSFHFCKMPVISPNYSLLIKENANIAGYLKDFKTCRKVSINTPFLELLLFVLLSVSISTFHWLFSNLQ